MSENMNASNPVRNQNLTILSRFPVEGIGRRYLWCKCYDKCLYKAAVNNWYSFNCDGCEYEDQGTLEFIGSAYIPELEEPDLTPEEDLETEMVDLSVNFLPISFLQEVLECNEHTA
ncbi:MAG: hypothetical protein GXP11_01995 [Gammaproteobacteria bacterium]|nr:hypothetical protein [Gammaproteobacteria bacterium]